MDSVKKEKLEAMERYRNGSQFLRLLMQFVLRVVLLGLFMSSPNWIPCFFSSVKFFFLVSVPKICSTAHGPRFIFMISNVIIIILVGRDSKLSKNPAERVKLYEEYIMKTQSAQSLAMAEVKEKEAFAEIVKAEALSEEKDEESEVEEVGEKEKEEHDAMEEEEEEEEEEGWLPAEELNKRVEDFIAMVNKQRKLEAKMLICCERKEGKDVPLRVY